ARARLERADVVLALAVVVLLVRAMRRRGRVPQRADDVGAADVAVLERHEHLIVDLGQTEHAAVLARAERRDAAPVPLLGAAPPAVGQPGEANLDAVVPQP